MQDESPQLKMAELELSGQIFLRERYQRQMTYEGLEGLFPSIEGDFNSVSLFWAGVIIWHVIEPVAMYT